MKVKNAYKVEYRKAFKKHCRNLIDKSGQWFVMCTDGLYHPCARPVSRWCMVTELDNK
jgi:hypothetical protein